MADQEDTLRAFRSEGVDPGMFWELMGRRSFANMLAHLFLLLDPLALSRRPLDKRQRRRAKRRAAREARNETR